MKKCISMKLTRTVYALNKSCYGHVTCGQPVNLQICVCHVYC